ncbi:phosphatase PAP2 family protein [Sphingobium sp. LMA1-1-1.1]|uniref:phosphatase PAP2 family protein n=1 Tax=Sphingobium sp. LMA1-1-1.1 TaxID=3135238 RepID=UPI0034369BC2
MITSAILDRFKFLTADSRLPVIDPLSVPALVVSWLFIGAATVGFAFTSFTLVPTHILSSFLLYAWLMLGGGLARRYGMIRIGLWLSSIATLTLVSMGSLMLITLVTAVALPFQDAALLSADDAVGFHWLALYQLFLAHPWLFDVNSGLYRLIIPLPYVVLTLLALCNQRKEAWALMFAWGICLAITVVIYPYFPAIGPYEYFHIARSDAPKALSDYPWLFDGRIASIRDHGQRVIDPLQFIGLVSFPSFHAGSSLLLAWTCLSVRWVGPVLAVLSVGMGAAALISGSHYLIDLVGGVSIALFAIWLASKLVGMTEGGAG